MAGTTAIYAWPYPEGDDVPDVPARILALAQAVETTVDSIDDRVDVVEGAWTAYTPTWSSSGAPSLGNGTLTGAYWKAGKTVFVRIALTTGTTTTYGSGSWTFSLPFTARTVSGHSSWSIWIGDVVARDVSTATYHRNTCHIGFSTTAVGVVDSYSSSSPFTWATGDHLALNIMYETA